MPVAFLGLSHRLRRLAWIAPLCLGLLASSHAPAWGANLRRTAIVVAVEEAKPAIVNIHGRKTVRADQPHLGENFKQVNGMGTGIALDPRGYIITNYHVVEGVANIQVTLHDGRNTVARLVAHDPKTDLAIIKVDVPQPMTTIKLGTSADLMIGEPVIAIGNAYGYEFTVTRGIISALHRTVQVSDEQKYHDLIQTDASINPGNSGGPLLNIDGQVIGINVAVRVGAQGIGFALPIDEALEVATRLISVERLENVSHGIVGKTTWDGDQCSFVVSSVRSGSPAEKSGLAAGDVITGVGERRVQRALDVELALLGRRPGEQIPLEVVRNGEPQVAQLALSSAVRSVAKAALPDRVWSTLGLRLEPISKDEFAALSTRYRGGLRVSSVRPGSPAAEQGIRRGDVLVGMHVWQTVTLENISYILDREDLETLQPLLFYILREGDTLYGHLRMASKPE